MLSTGGNIRLAIPVLLIETAAAASMTRQRSVSGETTMTVKKNVVIAMALGALGIWSPWRAEADEANKLSYLTFSQPVALPGRVLPAGVYTFRLADVSSDHSIVQVFNQKGTQLIATLTTIADHRLTPTDETVIAFGERSGGAPPPITRWFYPGETTGWEFYYPKESSRTR
jgi:hypothetical protein